MNQKFLLTLWGGMFAVCATLGFLPAATGFAQFLLVVLALAFFIPPALLLWLAHGTGDRHTAALVRNLAAASLAVTLVLLVANVLSLLGSTTLGDLLYTILVIASAPMACGQYWIMSLFCWACLLFAGNHILKIMKTRT